MSVYDQQNYWQKPDRVPVFVTGNRICYQPDYLTPSGLRWWHYQVAQLVRDGIVKRYRWYHRFTLWFWND